MTRLENLPVGSSLALGKNRTRDDLRKDTMISLGYPIINIELDNDHLDQAINAALKKFWEYHPDGSYEDYFTYVVTDYDAQNGYITFPETIDTVTEVIALGNVGYPTERVYTGQYGTDAQDMQEYYSNNPIPPNPNVSTNGSNNPSGNFGTPEYALVNSTMYNYAIGAGTPYTWSVNNSGALGSLYGANGSYVGGGLKIQPGAFNKLSYADFFEMKQNFSEMKSVLGIGNRKTNLFKFSKYPRKCILYFPVKANDGLCFKAHINVDPDLYPEHAEAFDDETVKDMTVCFAKQIWGQILRKFGGVVLIGGVTLDGQGLYDEASQELEKIIAELKDSQPIPMLIG